MQNPAAFFSSITIAFTAPQILQKVLEFLDYIAGRDQKAWLWGAKEKMTTFFIDATAAVPANGDDTSDNDDDSDNIM